eukprot:3918299-Amphidinium_carterae.1
MRWVWHAPPVRGRIVHVPPSDPTESVTEPSKPIQRATGCLVKGQLPQLMATSMMDTLSARSA